MKQRKTGNITLQEVANHAGVSKTTASVALNGGDYVSEETRHKVIVAAQELGYVYNRAAASLRSNASSTVGLIIPDLDNSFYTALLSGVNTALNKLENTILLGSTNESLTVQDRLISSMLEYRVCGIILFAVLGSSNELIARIKNLGIPVVLVNRNFSEFTCDYIGIDDVLAGQLATEHLVERGHRRIAYLGGTSELSSWYKRREGYERVLKEHQIQIDESLIIEGPPTQESGYKLAEEILKLDKKPSGIFCFNDVIAIGAMMKLEENGIIPGRDIAIVGVDDIPEASIIKPKLTTVSSYPFLRGVKAANILHERINGYAGEPQSIIIEPQLIIRDSSNSERINQ
ncbi:LacI family transcriptional regulator [Anaerosolibacter carboniphilus]|uniref:LacI family transcriptional regulator n=1 Tax=Anaerosolibacter carboniphilus TaxID=1417629 RepID=A0A841KSZ5_9FIRM|nr:LacI family DNA-binding transcriptional regulator [Anaerosolibacter carboniphilus]MBB6215278.1 LacI family transcriptional regulator [Anaerosolibacter carboniphilus]